MILTAAVSALLVLAVGASLSLVVLTTRLADINTELGVAIESVRLVEEMEVDLLTHSRQINRTPRTSESERAFAGTEGELRRRLGEFANYIGSQEEAALVDRVEERVQTYLEAQRFAENAGRSEASVLAARNRLDVAFAELEELVLVNVVQARTARDNADRWNRRANWLGGGMATALTVGAGALLIWIWRFALRPLFGLAETIERFSAGDRSARVPVVGLWELREMANRFNDMAAALARERENQLVFLASVAHDLRTPLTALRVSAALGASDDLLPSPDQVRKTLGIVGRQVENLDRMVGDLLDATRIEAGHLELCWQERDARSLVQESVELYADSLADRLSLCTPSEELVIRCDPIRIGQVLHNLLSNAIKFSPSSGRIDVEARRAGEAVMFAVTDRGIGIAAEDRSRIFKPFGRAASGSRIAPGTGLGLSVSKRIVEAHGGRLEVESKPGSGSTFRVFVPRLVRQS